MLEIVALALCIYIVTSCFFFRFPHFLHVIKSPKLNPVHISHRGGAGERTENTLEAFQHAVDLGTDMLELDCHITLDGEVVVLHDPNLKRTTGVDVDISELNYDHVPPYSRNLEVEYHPGNYYTASSLADLQILRLQDLFTAFPDTPMNIDIKADDDRLITRVAELIRQYGREKITVWGGFSASVSEKCREANPDVPLFFPLTPVLWMFAGYVLGFLPFLSMPYDYLELPLISAFNYPEFTDAYGLQSFKARLLLWLADRLLMSPRLYAHLKRRGIPVIFWVCNTTESYEAAFKMGAQGIMTDYPSFLRTFLHKHPEMATTKTSVLPDDQVKKTQVHQQQQFKNTKNASDLKFSLRRSVVFNSKCPEWRMVGD